MENSYDNEEYGTHGDIPTIVTNSPTSFSTTDVVLPVTTTDPADHGPAPAVGIIDSSNSNNNGNSSDSNVDSTTASTGSITFRDCPIRASGRVCICDLCEATRLRLLAVRCRAKQDKGTATDTVSTSFASSRIQRNDMTNVATSDPSAARNKRSREEYKYGADDDDDNVDDVNHSDIPPASAVVHPRGHHDTTSAMAVATEVVTTSTAQTAITNSNSNTYYSHTNDTTDPTADLDPEQHKLQIMSRACRTILQCIGEDPDREGLQKTPERWAKALLFLCHGYHLSPSQVTNNAIFGENHNEMVVVRNIDVHSLCEHHMVPFTGHVHIGYIPNGKIIGLSKLARLADLFARRLQVQERLTRQIADAILESIHPLGVAVVMECTHYCMVMRGVQKTGTMTTTSSVRGCFETNSKTRAEFFSILHGGGK